MNEIFQQTSGEMENAGKNKGLIVYVVANMQELEQKRRTKASKTVYKNGINERY